MLDSQHDCVGISSIMNNVARSFDVIPATSLSDLHNYFDAPIKLFLNPYLTGPRTNYAENWIPVKQIVFIYYNL